MIDEKYIEYVKFFDDENAAQVYADELRERSNDIFRVLPHESQFYVEQDIP